MFIKNELNFIKLDKSTQKKISKLKLILMHYAIKIKQIET